ncbi:hypothetical protein Y1Q_0014430 [Alligator mississippiensis]|uniref:Uncharacterized protein n=1 Tax=Alligator mississippiensis TaxID=8496 RepID=A0A151PCQ5_ALLMI|nr:hypothetical protein Y1Q_0014430 [Alligator mississippiensis]
MRDRSTPRGRRELPARSLFRPIGKQLSARAASPGSPALSAVPRPWGPGPARRSPAAAAPTPTATGSARTRRAATATREASRRSEQIQLVVECASSSCQESISVHLMKDDVCDTVSQIHSLRGSLEIA